MNKRKCSKGNMSKVHILSELPSPRSCMYLFFRLASSISTLSKNQAPPIPLLSWRILTLVSLPKSTAFTMNTSSCEQPVRLLVTTSTICIKEWLRRFTSAILITELITFHSYYAWNYLSYNVLQKDEEGSLILDKHMQSLCNSNQISKNKAPSEMALIKKAHKVVMFSLRENPKI